MASYAARVKADVERWRTGGLIDAATAAELTRDIEAHDRRSFSFGSVLAMMAALLFAAAILLIIAANWEAFPRIGRVVMLFATIAAGYVGGALLKSRGNGAFAEGAWIIAAAAFGGAIALIGQMYHLTGDEKAAVLTWCIGTAVAAAGLRSGPLTVASVGIGVAWLLMYGFDWGYGTQLPLGYLVLAAGLWAVSYWTESAASRHLILLSLIGYALLLAVDEWSSPVGAGLAVLSAAVFALAIGLPEQTERVVRLNGHLAFHGLLGFLTGMTLLQFQHVDEIGLQVICALVVFGAVAAAVVLAGRSSRGLRWLAYLGFSGELAFIYVVMVGSMLGTAGLFFASGFVLAAVAFVILRIEKRLNAPASPPASPPTSKGAPA